MYLHAARKELFICRAVRKKKAANGAGSIRKKTVIREGKEYTYWEARYTILDSNSRQVQHSISGKTQSEVAKRLREVTASIDAGKGKHFLVAKGSELLGQENDEKQRKIRLGRTS